MRLYLVRHGKAERDSSTGRDEDRALNKRGERQAQWLGERLASMPRGERPTLIVSSPAVRARDTARILQDCLNADLRLDESLSLGTAIEDALAAAESAAESRDPAVLVGHNPTFEHLLGILTSAADCEMRTGQAAVLELPAGAPLVGRCGLIEKIRREE